MANTATLEQIAVALERGGVFRQWVESSHAGFWVIDSEACTTFVNRRMAAMLGYEPADMLGVSLFAFMDERGEDIAKRNIERRRLGIDEQHDFEFVSKDGARVYTSLETSPYLDEAGNYAGAVAFASDITQRREAEQRAQHLAAIVESTGDGVISLTPDGIITSWNPGAERIFGFSSTEAIGRHIGMVANPDAPQEQHAFLNRTLSGTPPTCVDTTRRRKDGTEIFVSVTLSALRDEFGEVTGIAGVVKDIGDIVAADRKLLANNRMLRSLIDCAGQAIFVKDADLRYRLVNEEAARAVGVGREEIVGKTDFDIASPDVAATLRSLDEEVMRTREQLSQEYSIPVDGDGQRWFIATKAPLLEHGPDGVVTGVVGVATDITALREARERERRLEAQMLHAQKLESLGLLAGGIAHDFNNLLVAILGNADLAATELSPSSPVQQELSAISTAARRASELCRQLLAYAGRGRFVIKRVELSDALSEMTVLLDVTIAKRAALQLDMSNAPVFTEADVTQLRQVFMNLITNASEAMGDTRGVIRVTTGTMVAEATYIAGLRPPSPTSSPDATPSSRWRTPAPGWIPRPSRGSSTRSSPARRPGAGWGWRPCSGSCVATGEPSASTSERGRGSSFRVLLPLAGCGELGRGACPGGASNGVVLVIDDETTILDFARRALGRAGYEVLTASSGAEGLTRYRADRERVSAVLLDVTMPGIDGHTTLAELRRLGTDVPVVLSSGFDEQEIKSRVGEDGLAGFLAKPYSAQELVACLRRVLERDKP